MTCDVPDGVTIEFPHYGIEVYPIDVDIRIQKREHAMAQFKLPEEAGLLVSENVEPWSLAMVNMWGEPSHRMVIGPDAISFSRNLDERPRARIELRDARYVLERTSIDRSFDGDDLNDMLETLLALRDDPGDVIQRHQIVNTDSARHIGDFSLTDRFLNAILVNPFPGSTFEMSGSIDIEGTLADGIQQLADRVEADWWVENDGTMYFGNFGSRGQSFNVHAHGGDITLSRYSVTQENNTVREVQVQADADTSHIQRYPGAPGATSAVQEVPLNVVATARTGEVDPDEGSTIVLEQGREYNDPEQVERAAARRLIAESMDGTSGSMEINGNASGAKDTVRQLDAGDLVYVHDNVQEECQGQVFTGAFLITDVHHRRTRHQGWRINLSVSKLISPEEIDTFSVFYDPISENQYGSMDEFEDAYYGMK